MKRIPLILLLLSAPLAAQDAPAGSEAGGKPPADAPAEAPADAVPEIPADYNHYVRKVYPSVDPTGEHNLYDLKNYTDKGKRHEYTRRMSQLVSLYLRLDMGATLAKLFDRFSREKCGEYATFKVLYANVLMQHPAGNPRPEQAEKVLREASAQFPDFAYPWYYLANIEEIYAQVNADRGIKGAVDALDRAISIQPDFLEARLLKAQFTLKYYPGREQEVLAQLEELVKGELPEDANEYANLIATYASVARREQLRSVIGEHLKREGLGAERRSKALLTSARACVLDQRFDDAIGIYQGLEKEVNPASDPLAALEVHIGIALCWRKKADAVRATGPRSEYDAFVEEARRYYLKACEVDSVHRRVAHRGEMAHIFVEFLIDLARHEKSAGARLARLEETARWLEDYLRDCDLSAAVRAGLETRLAQLRRNINPTEQGYLEELRTFEAQGDIVKLRDALSAAAQRVLRGERFRGVESLDYFLHLLDSGDRRIVRDAAFLSADTALQLDENAVKRTGEAIADRATQRAGAAIADRFEKEEELNSTEQEELQGDLCEAIRRLQDSRSTERVLLHFAGIAEKSASTHGISRIVSIWSEERELKRIKNAPAKLLPYQTRRPAEAAAWLRKLAEAIQKEREGT